MKKIIISLAVLTLLTFGNTATAQDWRGRNVTLYAVVSSTPVVDHFRDYRGGVERRGHELVLISDGDKRLIRVDDPAALRGMMGQQVRVVGRFDRNGDMFRIDRVEVVRHDRDRYDRWRWRDRR